MPLGDHLNAEDYAAQYNDRWQEKRGISKGEWLVLALFAILVSLQWGCDSQAAEYTAQAEQEAHEKKLKLLSMPITWTATVTQCDTKNGCRTRYYLPSKEGR